MFLKVNIGLLQLWLLHRRNKATFRIFILFIAFIVLFAVNSVSSNCIYLRIIFTQLHDALLNQGPVSLRGEYVLESESDGVPLPLGQSNTLTATRPNSQARSSGVFPAASEMQGFDWCCSSISVCNAKIQSSLQTAHNTPPPTPPPRWF